MIKKLNDELDHLPFIIKLIVGVIMVFLITMMSFLFVGVAHALTPVEANFNYTQNGQNVSYNIKPDGGTTGFIYENEFFGQNISHSAYKHYLPSSGSIGEIKTTNINGYFQNPCGSGQDISYTMKINFYKQPSDENTMAWVRVTNGIDGCTGYFEVINGVYTYNNVCNLKSGDVPKFSLYFEESSRGQTYYRVGIPINFSYTCQVGNQAIIDANNANTNKMIENQNQNTERMIDKMILFHEADEEEWEEEKGLLQSILSAIGGIFSSSIDDPSNTLNGFNNSIATNNTVSSLLLLPVRLYQNVLNNINGSCNSFTLGSLFNHNLTMTCIQPQSFLGSALYGVIDVIISGFFILHIRKKFVDIFNHLTSLRTGGNELE